MSDLAFDGFRKAVVFRNGVPIVAPYRLPTGKHNGTYRELVASDLKVLAGQAVIGGFNGENSSSGLQFSDLLVDRVITNATMYISKTAQEPFSMDPVRRLGLEIQSDEVRKICGTGYHMLVAASQAIRSGDDDIVLLLAGENMTRAVQISQATRTEKDPWKFLDGELKDLILLSLYHEMVGMDMAATAQKVGQLREQTLEELAEYSYQSHVRAVNAQSSGYLTGIVPVNTEIRGVSVHLDKDEGVRSGTTIEKIMKTPELCPLVLAGTASQVSDGGAGMIMMSEKKVKELSLKPEFYLMGYSVATIDPTIMGLAPVPALHAYLEKSKTTVNEYAFIIVNEAFATQVMAVRDIVRIKSEMYNPNGGAIAFGHPITATGAILTVDALHNLKRIAHETGKETVNALVTACIGGGQATLLHLSYQRNN